MILALASACNRTSTTNPLPKPIDSLPVTKVDPPKPVVDTIDPMTVKPNVDSAGSASNATDNNVRKAGDSKPDPIVTTYRLTVSFISIGGGIDYAAKQKYDAFVADFGKRNKTKLAHETVGWGREGEVDYCFKLAELKDAQKSAFVTESKAMFVGNDLVKLKENASCRQPRK